MSFVPDKSKMKDVMGRFLTTSLFLEPNYNEELAVYTLSDEDKEYNGVVYPSLRRLYMETSDPTEYQFASKYLYSWDHWQRLLKSNLIAEEIEKWRMELEVKLRSDAVKAILAAEGFQALKWAADGNWRYVYRGRSTKKERERNKEVE